MQVANHLRILWDKVIEIVHACKVTAQRCQQALRADRCPPEQHAAFETHPTEHKAEFTIIAQPFQSKEIRFGKRLLLGTLQYQRRAHTHDKMPPCDRQWSVR